ncbi:MAG: ATP-binding cassette domain-containing protein [Ardenticatenaceae bacterium]|nr:ATP-binding cassette domain-containing protein [Ardenticatenaceae bacterium]
MKKNAIEVEGLVKLFGDSFRAVDNISFEVASGEIFGFLGPNGAGKSTTVRILTTLSLPTAGRVSIGGHDVVKEARKVRRISGVALQEVGLDSLMTAAELLLLQARLFGLSRPAAARRVEELLQLVQLEKFANKPVGQYSGGMRRRLDLALALVHQPEILFLDEPTTGLDPVSRRDIWAEVRRLNRELGMTIFLTTQYLEEADELADRIAIINRGRIVIEGSPETLKVGLGNESINISFVDQEAAQLAHSLLCTDAKQVQIEQKSVRLYLQGAATAVPGLISKLTDANIKPLSLMLTEPTLDDVFLEVTGEAFSEKALMSNQST